jgi:hypothetical protein
MTLRTRLELEAMHRASGNQHDCRRPVLRALAICQHHAPPPQHEHQLVQHVMQVRFDLPVVARAARLDGLDVQHGPGNALRRLSIQHICWNLAAAALPVHH